MITKFLRRANDKIYVVVHFIQKRTVRLVSKFNYHRLSAFVLSKSLGFELRSAIMGIVSGPKLGSFQKSQIRRNLHRIEKGMVMQPRRSIFAEDYIMELVLSIYKHQDKLSKEERKWAKNTLISYFSGADQAKSDAISSAYKFYMDHLSQKLIDNVPGKLIPNIKNTQIKTNILDFGDFVRRRRSVRWFTDELIDQSIINECIDISLQAPSACNRQPFHFYLLQNTDAEKVASLAGGTAGWKQNIRNLIVVVGDQSFFDALHDRHVIFIDASLATMQLILAMHSNGIGSCVINWPDIPTRQRKLANLIQLKEYEVPVCMLAFGVPSEDGLTPVSTKKTYREIMKVIKL